MIENKLNKYLNEADHYPGHATPRGLSNDIKRLIKLMDLAIVDNDIDQINDLFGDILTQVYDEAIKIGSERNSNDFIEVKLQSLETSYGEVIGYGDKVVLLVKNDKETINKLKKLLRETSDFNVSIV